MDFNNKNTRWKRDDDKHSNPFQRSRPSSNRFNDLKPPEQNSRWKREDSDASSNCFRRENRFDNRLGRLCGSSRVPEPMVCTRFPRFSRIAIGGASPDF